MESQGLRETSYEGVLLRETARTDASSSRLAKDLELEAAKADEKTHCFTQAQSP